MRKNRPFYHILYWESNVHSCVFCFFALSLATQKKQITMLINLSSIQTNEKQSLPEYSNWEYESHVLHFQWNVRKKKKKFLLSYFMVNMKILFFLIWFIAYKLLCHSCNNQPSGTCTANQHFTQIFLNFSHLTQHPAHQKIRLIF